MIIALLLLIVLILLFGRKAVLKVMGKVMWFVTVVVCGTLAFVLGYSGLDSLTGDRLSTATRTEAAPWVFGGVILVAALAFWLQRAVAEPSPEALRRRARKMYEREQQAAFEARQRRRDERARLARIEADMAAREEDGQGGFFVASGDMSGRKQAG